MITVSSEDPTGSIVITNSNTAILAGLPPFAVNLSNSTVTPLSLPKGVMNVSTVKASADGSHIFGVLFNISSGTVYSINPSTYTMKANSFGYLFWTDLAVSPDGSQFAAIEEEPGVAGEIVGFFDSSLRYLNANAYPELSPPDDVGVIGATFSPGGKMLVVPQGDSIEFWNAANGRLMGRLMTPDELKVITYPEGAAPPLMALDSSGQTIYAVSNSGITVMTLPQPLDQMSARQWAQYRPAGTIGTEFHGTITSRMKAMRREIRSGRRLRKYR